MLLMKESVLSLKDTETQHWPQVLKVFYDWPVKYYFCQFWYRLWDLVWLSIYSTRALFHRYFVAMKYR